MVVSTFFRQRWEWEPWTPIFSSVPSSKIFCSSNQVLDIDSLAFFKFLVSLLPCLHLQLGLQTQSRPCHALSLEPWLLCSEPSPWSLTAAWVTRWVFWSKCPLKFSLLYLSCISTMVKGDTGACLLYVMVNWLDRPIFRRKLKSSCFCFVVIPIIVITATTIATNISLSSLTHLYHHHHHHKNHHQYNHHHDQQINIIYKTDWEFIFLSTFES